MGDNQPFLGTPDAAKDQQPGVTTPAPPSVSKGPLRKDRGGRRGKPYSRQPRDSSFTKRTIPPSIMMDAIHPYYQVFTSNNGVNVLVETVYQTLGARDSRIQTALSLELFKYAVCIAWICRLLTVHAELGVRSIPGYREIRDAAQGLLFPHVICKYIETLGSYDLLCGVTIIPFASDYRTMIEEGSDWYVDPLEFILAAGREDPDNHWSLDTEWLAEYNRATATFGRYNLEVRRVLSGNDASPELTIGYSLADARGSVTPVCAEKQPRTIAELGACYQLRDYRSFADWPHGDNHVIPRLFETGRVEPGVVIAQVVLGSIVKIQSA